MDRVSSMLSFVKVVEHGGFSSAARQLNLATSVVTTHVKWLEERLGVRLLNRTTRNVSLTEAGRAYYERCVQILSEIEDAEEAAQEAARNSTAQYVAWDTCGDRFVDCRVRRSLSGRYSSSYRDQSDARPCGRRVRSGDLVRCGSGF
jgi:DNA-binding MarR family transcriptional regulator